MTPFWKHLCLSLTDCDVINQNLPKKNQLHNTQHINSTTQYTTYQFNYTVHNISIQLHNTQHINSTTQYTTYQFNYTIHNISIQCLILSILSAFDLINNITYSPMSLSNSNMFKMRPRGPKCHDFSRYSPLPLLPTLNTNLLFHVFLSLTSIHHIL